MAGLDVLLFNNMAGTDEKPQHAVVMLKYYGTVPRDETRVERLLKTQVLSFSERRIPNAGAGYQTLSPDLWTEEESERFIAHAKETGIITQTPQLSQDSLDNLDIQDAMLRIFGDALVNSMQVYKAYPHVSKIEVKAAAVFKGRSIGSEAYISEQGANQAQVHFCRTPDGDLQIFIHGYESYDYEAIAANTARIDASLLPQ